jgi:heat shock protein HslJ
MRGFTVLMTASLITVLAGCARFGIGAGGSGGGPSVDLLGTWELERGTGPGGVVEVPDGWQVTLVFEADRLHGQACNNYGGGYELDGNRITFSPMYMTEMACEEPMMSVESAYHAALAAVTEVERAGDSLVLRGEGTELTFVVLPPVPDAALQGTRWILDSLISGDAVSSVQGEAWLELSGDGSLHGSTGCRELAGRYVVDGDRLVTSELQADGSCPEPLVAQDAHVVGVLEGGFSAAVDGRRLTLIGSGGDGLGYLVAAAD